MVGRESAPSSVGVHGQGITSDPRLGTAEREQGGGTALVVALIVLVRYFFFVDFCTVKTG